MAALRVRIKGSVLVDVAAVGSERWVSLGDTQITFVLESPDVTSEMEAGLLQSEDGMVTVRVNPSTQMSLTLSEEVLSGLVVDEMVSGMRGLL